MKKILLIIALILPTQLLIGKEMPAVTTQIIKGRVIDENTLQPIVGANVVLLDTNPIIGTITDVHGEFKILQVPIGRVSIRFSFVGYHEISMNNVVVDAGKEVVLEIKMQESVNMMKGVVITDKSDNYEVTNEMAVVSARGFNVEETQRYAGSRNDPARMASNFAGVSGANDARNDIIIRGNSPSGLLWRLEGLNIPNPNHFAAVGTTGGPVSMLNNNLLANSEFYTGAFPANYGNALSGVFDIKMRNGNSEKREYLAQIGFNGIELGAEGPFKKGGRSSYLVNYRYSVPALMQELNFNAGTGNAVPYYQDLSYKLNFYTPKGKLSVFGLWGNSHIDLLGSETTLEELEDNLYNGADLDIYNTSQTGIFGTDYLHFLGKDTYWKNTVAYSYTSFGAELDTVFRNESFDVIDVQNYVSNVVDESKVSWVSTLHHKLNLRNTLEIGTNVDFIDAEMNRDLYNNQASLNGINYSGNTVLLQAHVSWQHRFNDQWKMNAGLHYQNLFLNSASQSLEPRIGIDFQATARQRFSLAYGRHSQTQASTVYFVETEVPGGETIQTNIDLGFTTSDHFVIGYQAMLRPNLKLVVEAYHQILANVPVESSESLFSMLNYGADFGVPDYDSLVNEGTGKNTGVELTLEKYFSNNYYFMATGSFFNSTYVASDQVERNTAFNGNYAANGLFGKEWSIGKKGNAFSLDFKVTYAGNRRYIPIDLEASNQAGHAVYDKVNAYEDRHPDYLRADIKATFKMQSKKITQEWSIDIQNVTNHQNVYFERYDISSGSIITSYQMGIWPMFQYRLLF